MKRCKWCKHEMQATGGYYLCQACDLVELTEPRWKQFLRKKKR